MPTRLEPVQAAPIRLPNTEQWDIRSRSGRSYRIFLAWPDTAMPEDGWDAVYLLDGNAWFGTLNDGLRMRARRPEVTGVRPAVAVGIGYPIDEAVDVVRRRYDLTPPRSGPAVEERETGGAELFLDFLTDELAPMVEARFGLAGQRRVLFGHSLGGLFVLHAVLTRPSSFAAFAAASPSLWFDDGALLRACGAARLPQAVRLMIAVGALEQPAAQAASPVTEEGPGDRAMIANARAVAECLRARSGAGPGIRFHVFEDENHASVVPVALGRALPFLLARPGASGAPRVVARRPSPSSIPR
ncbi:alpha/beta hydrolase [Methylobacterium terricola]|uniref:Alpha/beta hydrolase n=1 Tax=Methylobacterium terricola TaxID=2583531 RepID=A0A5C4LKL8_9HYPH|nr:alpha/beta hydrolase-fold protein [Methylobacterium terricola]TNC12917.1 alpha/beta hydrolase [Methylobacterium terricola]